MDTRTYVQIWRMGTPRNRYFYRGIFIHERNQCVESICKQSTYRSAISNGTEYELFTKARTEQVKHFMRGKAIPEGHY